MDSRLTGTVVTQIPLESPRPDAQSSKPRPPWIRPVRKKTLRSSASNESTSQHSSPEGFSPSDAFLDLNSAAKLTSPPPSGAFNGSAYGSPTSTSFMDTGGMEMSPEASMAMNPSDLLAMFSANDGSGIDVAQLLMSPPMEGQTLPDGTPTSAFFNLSAAAAGGVVSPAP